MAFRRFHHIPIGEGGAAPKPTGQGWWTPSAGLGVGFGQYFSRGARLFAPTNNHNHEHDDSAQEDIWLDTTEGPQPFRRSKPFNWGSPVKGEPYPHTNIATAQMARQLLQLEMTNPSDVTPFNKQQHQHPDMGTQMTWSTVPQRPESQQEATPSASPKQTQSATTKQQSVLAVDNQQQHGASRQRRKHVSPSLTLLGSIAKEGNRLNAVPLASPAVMQQLQAMSIPFPVVASEAKSFREQELELELKLTKAELLSARTKAAEIQDTLSRALQTATEKADDATAKASTLDSKLATMSLEKTHLEQELATLKAELEMVKANRHPSPLAAQAPRTPVAEEEGATPSMGQRLSFLEEVAAACGRFLVVHPHTAAVVELFLTTLSRVGVMTKSESAVGSGNKPTTTGGLLQHLRSMLISFLLPSVGKAPVQMDAPIFFASAPRADVTPPPFAPAAEIGTAAASSVDLRPAHEAVAQLPPATSSMPRVRSDASFVTVSQDDGENSLNTSHIMDPEAAVLHYEGIP